MRNATARTAGFLLIIVPLLFTSVARRPTVRVCVNVATTLFIATALILQRERRPHMVLGVSLILGFGLVHAFKAILPTPIPTLFG